MSAHHQPPEKPLPAPPEKKKKKKKKKNNKIKSNLEEEPDFPPPPPPDYEEIDDIINNNNNNNNKNNNNNNNKNNNNDDDDGGEGENNSGFVKKNAWTSKRSNSHTNKNGFGNAFKSPRDNSKRVQSGKFKIGTRGTQNFAAILKTKKTPTKKRAFIVEEILTTEETYVESMRKYMKEYIEPMQKKKIFVCGSKEEKFLKGNLATLEPLHAQLLDDISKRVEEVKPESDKAIIGDLFVKFIPFMTMYNSYLDTFDEGSQVVGNMCKDEEFMKFITDECGNEEKPGDHVSFMALRSTPVQRIPRYLLLFKDLLKNTPKEHPDHENILIVKEAFEKLATKINEHKRQGENLRRINELDAKLQNKEILIDTSIEKEHNFELGSVKIPSFCHFCKNVIPGLGKKYQICTECNIICHKKHCWELMPHHCGQVGSLLTAGRHLLQEGILTHHCVDSRESKPQIPKKVNSLVLLFSDCIVIIYEHDTHSPTVENIIRWYNTKIEKRIKFEISLDEPQKFIVTTADEIYVHTFYCESMEKASEWISKVNKAFSGWMANQSRFIQNENKESYEETEKKNKLEEENSNCEILFDLNVTFKIQTTVPVSDQKKKKEWTAYVVEIFDGNGNKRTVLKRYSQFHKLNSELKEIYSKEQLPPMPAKRILRSNTNKIFIQRRCMGLQKYLNGLKELKGCLDLPIVHEFFEIHSSASNIDNSDRPDSEQLLKESDDDDNNEDDEYGSTDDEYYDEDDEEIEEDEILSALVLFDFNGEDGITISAGEYVDILSQENKDWWYIMNQNGKEGYVPSTFVSIEEIL